MKFQDKLKQLEACFDAIEWVGNRSFKRAWAECERADWMLWYICKVELGTRRDRIHVICDCAETALRYVSKGENRPKKAIEAARTYADNPTQENLDKLNAARVAAWVAAWAAAWAAARAAAGDAAGDAAGAAAWVAAGDAAGDAAGAAAGAAARAAARDAAGDAARAAAWAAAWAAALKDMADLVRKNFKVFK